MEKSRREWMEIAAVSAVSYVLYMFNMVMLFLIPLQILSSRKGERSAVIAAAGIFAAIVVTSFARLDALGDVAVRRALLVLEIGIPLSLLTGLVLTGREWAFIPGARRIVKLALVGVGAAVVSVPVISIISQNEGLTRLVLMQVTAAQQMMAAKVEADPVMVEALAGLFSDPGQIAEDATGVILRGYLMIFFVLIGGGIWIGDFAASRTAEGLSYPRLRDFRVPVRGVWIFLLGWSAVLFDRVSGPSIGPEGYLAWNVAIASLIVYGVQGVGVVRHLLVQRGVARWIRVVLFVILSFALLWPGVNLFIVIGIPGIGVTETWVRYRSQVKE